MLVNLNAFCQHFVKYCVSALAALHCLCLYLIAFITVPLKKVLPNKDFSLDMEIQIDSTT